jgi:hypothetical protein
MGQEAIRANRAARHDRVCDGLPGQLADTSAAAAPLASEA